jgi:CRISPR/Cas system-associated exonuclease Cas4 (RecB family)
MKKFTHVTPSQIATYTTCPRQWWFNKVLGLPVPQKPSAALGEKVHSTIEAYLESGDSSVLHVVARPAQAKLDELRALSPLVETKMQRALRNGLTFIGRIDLLALQQRLVVDHKTTSDLKYAKSEEELQQDVQMLSYAYEVYCRNPGPEVRVAHNVLLTRGLPTTRYTETTVSAPQILAGWSRIQDVTDEMLEVAQVATPADVKEERSQCEKYGGCAFKEQCKSIWFAKGERTRSPYDTISDSGPRAVSTTPEVRSMSTKHSASVLRSMGLDDDTIRAAIAKGTCTDDIGLTGAVVASVAKATGINPPEAPTDPRIRKTEVMQPAPVVEAPKVTDIREQIKLLLANGWSQDDIDSLSDDAFQFAVTKNIKRIDVTLITGTGLVQGTEYDGVVVRVEPVAAPKRPTRTAPVEVESVEPVAEAPVRRGTPLASDKMRQPRNAVPRLEALGWARDDIAGMSTADMHRILDGGIRPDLGVPEDEAVVLEAVVPVVVAPVAPTPVVIEAVAPVVVAPAPAPAPIIPVEEDTGLVLYIDCFPERGVSTRDLSDILAPYMRKVEAEARDEKTGRAAPVAHYGLIPYNNGEKQVIGYLLSDLTRITGHITVDSRMPISTRALEVLRPLATVVIVGRR